METVDLELEQGASMRVTLLYTDANNVPIPLDGFHAHMQARKRAKFSLPVLLELSTANGGITLGPADGEIHLFAGSDQTAGITRNCVYDLHLIPDLRPTDITRAFGGKIIVTPGVTAP